MNGNVARVDSLHRERHAVFMRGGLAIEALLAQTGSESAPSTHVGTARLCKRGNKRRRNENNAPCFIVNETKMRLPEPLSELDYYPVKLDRVLKRCSRNNRLYSASEAVGGNAVLVAPGLRSSSLSELTAILNAPNPLTMGHTYKLADADTFVGLILGFRSDGTVAATAQPQITELFCGGVRSGLYVVSSCTQTQAHRYAPAALADRFCNVACPADR